MPKIEIDYSNTIIYKITCKDETITDLYVGHTTNFVQRKYAHKVSCTNSKSINYNCKVYQVIRNNGGWDNWNMEIIDFINCKDLYEARKKEHEYFVSLNATLNSIEPLPQKRTIQPSSNVNQSSSNVNINKKVIYCSICKKYFNTEMLLEIHNNTTKHKNRINNQTSVVNTDTKPKFVCEKCDFITSKQNEYDRHIETNKHKRLHVLHEKNSDMVEHKTFTCICGKKYNHHTSLAKHKRNCVSIHTSNASESIEHEHEQDKPDISNQNIVITPEMFMKMLNDRDEMLKIIKVLSENKNGNNVTGNTINDNTTINNNSNNNSNNNNNTFNMNFFLNEQCKDAMNMKDFVNSIQLNITDLENVGRLGYVEGMSNILIDNLQKTDIYKRPVHCSDVKRETLYVKDNNEWERDGPDHPKMVNAVLAVEQKNVALVSEWAKAHPRCMNSHTRENETYFKLSKVATDGEKDGNIAKVIRKVAKRVAIDKDT
jgi:hypothetical protein